MKKHVYTGTIAILLVLISLHTASSNPGQQFRNQFWNKPVSSSAATTPVTSPEVMVSVEQMGELSHPYQVTKHPLSGFLYNDLWWGDIKRLEEWKKDGSAFVIVHQDRFADGTARYWLVSCKNRHRYGLLACYTHEELQDLLSD